MRNYILTGCLTLLLLKSYAQANDTAEIWVGPETCRKEVIKIVKKYSMLLDSVCNNRFSKKFNDSLNIDLNVPMNFPGYDGGYQAYLMDQEDEKILSIINRFLKIDRITSSSKWSSGNGPVHYDFKYNRTIKKPDGTVQTILGVVSWQGD